jgi:uncharacterized protein (DUF4415 family)
MKGYRREPGSPLTPQEREQLEALRNLPDDQIDTSDAPALPESAWANAIRGRFYRPIKQAISLRLDADVIEWLKKDGEGYQTRANLMLRERMLKDIGVSKQDRQTHAKESDLQVQK